jgi:hypothetical protein
MLDERTPEELAKAGITIELDERGKRHITLRADPIVQLRDGRPRTVFCSALEGRVPRMLRPFWGALAYGLFLRVFGRVPRGCELSRRFRASGPTDGWVPPHPGVERWTCPSCRGGLAPVRMGKGGALKPVLEVDR